MDRIEDIIPMKLSAVAARGSKKDFYDIYFLLKHYTLEEMFGFFDRKFDDMNKFHIIKSLTYFDDAEKETDPVTLQKITWKEIKQAILREIR
jgi:predicted nucleotidyltransferase component of viral defense system